MNDHFKDGIIFIQGSKFFFDSHYDQLTTHSDWKLIFICTDTKFFSSDSWRESHADNGSVTNCSWTVYQQHLNIGPIKNKEVKRTLHHLLKTAESSNSTSQLSKATSAIVMSDMRVDWNSKFPAVSTHSVYDKEKIIKRLITDEELMDIYDIELSFQLELKNYWKYI
jgi:hypothetical protein